MIAVLGLTLPHYPRNKNTVTALQQHDSVTIITISRLWRPYQRWFFLNPFIILWQLVTLHIPKAATHVFILFPDHEYVLTAALYRWLYRRRYKIIFDPLISIYDTYIFNKPLSRGKWWRGFVWHYERWLWQLADIVLIDTPAHGQYLKDLLKLPFSFDALPISADEDVFKPTELNNNVFWNTAVLKVIWYGRVSDMHGMEYILSTIEQLEGQPIEFTIMGSLERFLKQVQPLIDRGQLRYIPVHGHDHLPLTTIATEVAKHHVCLGVFGQTEKAARVVANKEVEALAAARCLITRHGPKEHLTAGQNCLMVDSTDPAALASVLRELNHNRQIMQHLARQGRAGYEQFFSTRRIQNTLNVLLERIA